MHSWLIKYDAEEPLCSAVRCLCCPTPQPRPSFARRATAALLLTFEVEVLEWPPVAPTEPLPVCRNRFFIVLSRYFLPLVRRRRLGFVSSIFFLSLSSLHATKAVRAPSTPLADEELPRSP